MSLSIQGWISSMTKQTETGGQWYPDPTPLPTPVTSCFPEETAEQDIGLATWYHDPGVLSSRHSCHLAECDTQSVCSSIERGVTCVCI